MAKQSENGENKEPRSSKPCNSSVDSDSATQDKESRQEWQQPREMPIDRDAELKNLRTLMLIAGICGPFSFIVGGVPLSLLALLCAIIAMVKFKELYSGSQSLEDSRRIKRAIIFSIIISSCSLVWNCVWLAMAIPQIVEMVMSQDFSSLYGASEGLGSNAPDKSIWD